MEENQNENERHSDLAEDEKEEEVIAEVDNANMLVLMRALHVQNSPHAD